MTRHVLPRSRKALRAEIAAKQDHIDILADACVQQGDQMRALRNDLTIAEDALEAERQWRLTSLPALLAAEERAVKAEARVAYLEDRLSPPRTFPELTRSQVKRHAALADAYHETKERP